MLFKHHLNVIKSKDKHSFTSIFVLSINNFIYVCKVNENNIQYESNFSVK